MSSILGLPPGASAAAEQADERALVVSLRHVRHVLTEHLAAPIVEVLVREIRSHAKAPNPPVPHAIGGMLAGAIGRSVDKTQAWEAARQAADSYLEAMGLEDMPTSTEEAAELGRRVAAYASAFARGLRDQLEAPEVEGKEQPVLKIHEEDCAEARGEEV